MQKDRHGNVVRAVVTGETRKTSLRTIKHAQSQFLLGDGALYSDTNHSFNRFLVHIIIIAIPH